jgi:hypothetical protein
MDSIIIGIQTSGSAASPSEYKYIYDLIKHKWHEEDGICPYCHAANQCVHWDGTGWTRDKTEFSDDLPDRPMKTV